MIRYRTSLAWWPLILVPIATSAADDLRVVPAQDSVEKYACAEFAIDAPTAAGNPFDPRVVDLTLVLQAPGGQALRVPAFFAQDYERQELPRSGRRAAWVYPTGRPGWKVRFAPAEVGTYTAVAEWKSAGREFRSAAVSLRCTPSTRRGFVRVSRQDPRYYEFSEGQPFFPIGQNLAFVGESQYVTLTRLEEIFARLSDNGANYLRIWTCCHDWALAVEARKSAWGRSWSWNPPIVALPGAEANGRKCLQLTPGRHANLAVSPSHSVALRPATNYVLSGRLKTEPGAQVQVVCGRHALDKPVASGPDGAWQEFQLAFQTSGEEYWLGRTAFELQGQGSAWLDELSLREAAGGPELLWEADVNREERGYYNPVDCFLLDRIIAAAEQRGIYLQLCLITRDVYMDSLKDEAGPQYQRAIEDAQRLLRYAVARWGYSTSVAAWEYFNEQNPGLPTDRFYRELGQYLEANDPYRHLRSTSTWAPSPRDCRHPQLDVADVHFYLRPAPDRDYVDEVAAALGNADFLRQHAPHKPALIGEFGLADRQWRPTRQMQDSREIADFHNGLWASALSGTSGTALFWWWDRLDARDHYPHYRPLADFLADVPWTTAGLTRTTARLSEPRLRLVGLQNRQRAYLWLFDPAAGFEQIVLHGASPETVLGVDLEISDLQDGKYRVQWWDTRRGAVVKEAAASPVEGRLRLAVPAFSRDLACRILP